MSLISILIIAISAFIGGYNGAPTEAPTQAPVEAPSQALSQALSQFATQAPAPVPNTSVEVAHNWAQAMIESADMELTPNVNLVFSNSSNCGAEISTAGRGGCTYTVGPDQYVVVLSPELANTQWGNHILFHELGHTVGLGECEAETFAHQFEEEELWSYPTCEEFGTP